MKTQIFLFIAFAMVLSIAATANSNGRMIVRIEKASAAKTIKVQLANLENKRTDISLVDTEGIRWFFESVSRQNGYATRLQLDGMPDGDYIILISRMGGQYAQALTLNEAGIDLFMSPGNDERDKSIAFLASSPSGVKGKLISHFSKEEGQQVSLQLANLLEKPATISMVSPNGGLMKQKSVTGQKGYNERWNLEGMANGNYFFSIQSEGTTVIQFLKLTEDGIELTDVQRMDRPVAEKKAILSVR